MPNIGQPLGDPYRGAISPYEPIPRPWWGARLWNRLFGVLVYDGPETCGHCTYWKPPGYDKIRTRCDKNYHGSRACYAQYHVEKVLRTKGDCKLLFGKEDTTKDETCDRFTGARKFKRRIR